jgi:hypothetical protein
MRTCDRCNRKAKYKNPGYDEYYCDICILSVLVERGRLEEYKEE